ncbi:Hsp33 family molecular chaperone HslO [Marinimicrobium alkaliphilum]|uniref:Hsp33 family molecular chaperone HslO n=1 Tax=Marinimicrobium alkaliphilum TaxID=2202654 RepID=UPI000DB8FE2A|nr:Hsp33 family molecular chaperone HslO [Marinimicrobium alkaliphilum]
MPSDDLLHRFIFDHCDVRGELVTLSESYREVLSHNPYPPAVQRLLGECLAAASLLSSTLKYQGLISIQARGDGPIMALVAEATHDNTLRGIVRLNPDQPLSAEQGQTGTLGDLLGKGIMAITIEPEKGERYQGIVPMGSDQLSECLQHYFQQSEQLDTRLWLRADKQAATGLLLQALPTPKNASREANQESWHTLCTLADTVTTEELLTLDHPQLLFRLFHEESPRLFSPHDFRFACSCSHERSANALSSLGREEVEQLLVEQGTITIDCQFCNQRYRFDAGAVRELFGDSTLH